MSKNNVIVLANRENIEITEPNCQESGHNGNPTDNGNRIKKVLATYADYRMPDQSNHASVVDNGYMLELKLRTDIISVTVQLPKVLTRISKPITFILFNLSIAPIGNRHCWHRCTTVVA